jgi:hypothetical protein
MGKVRVHDLAKKLNLTNQELMTKLAAKGIVVKTHSSSIDEAQAMTALQSGAGADLGAGGQKTRTVLRRRRADEVEVPAVEESTPIVAVMSAPEVVSPQTFEAQEPIVKAVAEAETVEPTERPEKVVEPEKAPVALVSTPSPIQARTSPISPVQPGARIIIPGNNVVRVIDADAIKARLAAEGRTFRPKTPLRPSGAPGLIRPSYSTVREIKVVHGGGGMPQMVDVTGQKAGPGARPGKRKGK